MTTQTLGIGIIGCGDIATRQHIPALLANPGVRLVHVSDTDLQRAWSVAAQFDVPEYSGCHHELLANTDVHAVIVATPPWATPHLVIDALRAGKDVLSEKPMALSLDEAQRVAKVERETGKLVQLGFTYRHGPLMDALRGWIAEGRLGSPLVIRIGVFDEVWAPETEPEHYARLMTVLQHGPPCIHDGAHSADHLHFLTRSRFRRVTAHGIRSRPEFSEPNYNFAYIEFENDDVAKLEICWFYPNFPKGEFEIVGPNGVAYFDREKNESVLRCGDEIERVTLDEDYVESCFRVQLEKFVAAVHSRSTPMPGTAEGIASLQLTKAFEQAMRESNTIAEEN